MSKRAVIEAMLRAGRPDLANAVAGVTAAVSTRVNMKGYEKALRNEMEGLNEWAEQQRADLLKRADKIKPEGAFRMLDRLGQKEFAKRFADAWKAKDNMAFTQTMADWFRAKIDLDLGIDWQEESKLRTELYDAQNLISELADKETPEERRKRNAEDFKRLVRETGRAQQAILKDVRGAIKRIEFWNGAAITIEPSYSTGTQGNIFVPVTYATIYLGNDRDAPSFTYFGPKELEDILHAGDTDFFRDPNLEQDYFNLIRELQQPGSTSKPGRIRKLYTARPVTDRKQFEKAARAKTMPNNIFLTDSLAEAEGYAAEYPPRDIWLVQIDERYLTKTQERGGMAAGNYQTMGPRGTAPVKRLELVQEG